MPTRDQASLPGHAVLLTSGQSDVAAHHGTHGFELLHEPYAIDELSRALNHIQN